LIIEYLNLYLVWLLEIGYWLLRNAFMGQKIHPKSHRLGVIYGWKSKWFSEDGYRKLLREDLAIRHFIQKKLSDARVENVEIERPGKGGEIIITIHTAKPGMVIGRGGSGIETLTEEIKQQVIKHAASIKVNIQEVRQSMLSSAVVAQNIADDLVKRIPFRRSIKQAIEQVKKAGAHGVKVQVSGRLNGAEIARTETVSWGSVPLHTLRADIDYAQAPAFTTYGVVGVAVWIYKGDIFNKKEPTIPLAADKDVLLQIRKIGKRGTNKKT
jgi:small subunit ribosomal protein S3